MRIKIFLLIIPLQVFNACQIVSESESEGNVDQTNTVIDISSGTTPEDLDTFNQFIHNGSQKNWVAAEFTLETLDGLQNCRLDDQMTLFENGTWVYDGGTDLCFGEDNRRARSGTYSLSFENQTMIFTDEEGESYVVEVLNLEEDEIVLKGVYAGLLGNLDVAGRYIVQ
jgi:hypothetical protein